MELAHIRTFVQIAKSGSMTKASHELHRTQPALSAQLAKLEEVLGEMLFNRTPKGMVLTDAGTVFLTYAEQALARLDDGVEALGRFRELEHGTLSIGGGVTAITYLLPDLFGDFAKKFPNIRLFVHEEASVEVAEDIVKRVIDLGVITLPTKISDPKHVAIEPWVEDELVLVVPDDHPLYEAESFTWEDIDKLPLVLFEGGSALRAQIDAKMAQANIVANVVMELRSVEAIKSMVTQGIGAAFVSKCCLDPGFKGIPCADGPIKRTLGVIYRKDLRLNPSATAFLEMMMEARDESLKEEFDTDSSKVN